MGSSYCPIFQCTTDSGLQCMIFSQPETRLVNFVIYGMDHNEPLMKKENVHFVDAMASISKQIYHDLGGRYIDDVATR